MKSAAARCSSARWAASAAGVSERAVVPASPLVHSTYVPSQPGAIHLATTPPEPISASSGCANTTIARSGTSVTTWSFRGSRGTTRILQEGGGTLSAWVTQSLPSEETTMADVLTVVAKIRAAKGKGDALAALLKEQVAAVRKAEPGCLIYRPHRSTKDPDLFIFYEQYKDDAAFDAHRKAPHLAAYRERGRTEARATPASCRRCRCPGACSPASACASSGRCASARACGARRCWPISP